MGKSDLSGIENFFSDLEAGESADTEEPSQRDEKSGRNESAKANSSSKKASRSRKSRRKEKRGDRKTREPVRLPTGRPAGKKDGEGPLRSKASLWIDVELLEAYRDRVYVERRHLGELIEEALRVYMQEKW